MLRWGTRRTNVGSKILKREIPVEERGLFIQENYF